ncbi:hypothetical protein ACQKMN_17075 [Ureibacillus composti]
MLTINKPVYLFAKVKPNNSIRNQQTHLLAKTISNMHRSIIQNLKITQRKHLKLLKKDLFIPTKFEYNLVGKISFFIYMEKEKIEFYFIYPEYVKQTLEEKLSSIWNNVTIEYLDQSELPSFGEDALKCQMEFAKEDGLSLHTNRTSNDLLNATLNVVEVLEKDDKVGILYNFIPTSQNSFKQSYIHTIEKVKKGQPTERKKTGIPYLAKMLISLIDTLMKDLSEAIAGKNESKAEDNFLDALLDKLNGGKQISESTEKKGRGHILESQIVVFSETKEKNRVRELSYTTSIADAFGVIEADNKFTKKSYKKKVDLTSTRLNGATVNKIYDEEAQNFLALPGRELIERYSFMDKVETHETQLAKDLQEGTFCIGDVTYRGRSQKAYLSDDEQFKKLTLLVIGPTRVGKSKLLANLGVNAIDNGECNIVFDFIKNCELSDEMASCLPKEKVLEIECSDFEKLQGMGYNEVGVSDDPFKQYENAKRQTSNTLTLINSVNDYGDSSRLTPKMERYLESACLVVYISNGSLKDVFALLLNHRIRHEFIQKVPEKQKEFLSEYIDSLYELDEEKEVKQKITNGKTTTTVSRTEIVGTKIQAGIIDRLNALKRNTYMELMLKKNTDNNINLVEEMQKNQLIVIKMPQAMFTTDAEKDVFTTYWMTKIWLALQVRADKYKEKDLVKVNLFIDEIYQVAHTEKFLKTKLSQIAKFGMKPIVSCHYINQLKYMRDELRSANTSYMLIAGCDKKNFDELKEELYPYTAEDLKNLKQFHSLNYIKTKDGYAQFITKLPKPIKSETEEDVNE